MVYLQLGESGVGLIIRYVTPVRGRRVFGEGTHERILGYVESQPDLELALPAQRNLQEQIPHRETQKEAWRRSQRESATPARPAVPASALAPGARKDES